MGSQKHTPKYLNVGTKNNVKTIFPMSSIILENKGVILYPKPWIAFGTMWMIIHYVVYTNCTNF